MQVYTQTLRAAGVPESTLATYEPYLGNMVGLVRGNLYYNLINWYRCLSCLPVGDTSKYMETMMGVKQVWKPVLYIRWRSFLLCSINLMYVHVRVQAMPGMDT